MQPNEFMNKILSMYKPLGLCDREHVQGFVEYSRGQIFCKCYRPNYKQTIRPQTFAYNNRMQNSLSIGMPAVINLNATKSRHVIKSVT